ncbi:MAG: hypothetical protein U5L76_05400 [Patescibacteria group bacterium]|nr:hypothetical protein [Patescibacteria group bacterium]
MNNKSIKIIRWLARTLGLIIVLFWLIISLGYAFSDFESFTGESLIINLLVIITTIGFMVAWRKEKLGSIILISGGIIHSIFAYFMAGHNHLFAVLISGFPFVIIGILFYAISCQKKYK